MESNRGGALAYSRGSYGSASSDGSISSRSMDSP